MRLSKLLTILALATLATSVQAQTGTLKVQFVLDGKAPKPTPIKVDKDPQFCGKFKLVDESLVIDAKTNGIANIVCYIRDANIPVPEKLKGSNLKPLMLDNQKCRFVPRVALLQTGQKLDLGNLDQVGHNIKIDPFAQQNPSINPLIPAGQRFMPDDVPNKVAERLPVKVSCSIHPWMAGHLVIRDNPYMAVSDKTGTLELKNIPPGKWEFQFWHERSGYLQNFSNGKKWRRGRTKLTISAGKTTDLKVLKVKLAEFQD